MSATKDSIDNPSLNQQPSGEETKIDESLENIESQADDTQKDGTTDKVKSTPLVLRIPKTKKKSKRDKGIYLNSMITKRIAISVNLIGRNIRENLEKIIVDEIEGKCIAEGYIKPGSVEIVTYSSGVLKDDSAIFDVVFTCNICLPVEGMLIDCIVRNVTKAGIRAETNEDVSPVTIFIARDHHFSNELFAQVKEDDDIRIRVIGQRFELNDRSISVIGELVDKTRKLKIQSGTTKRKPKLIIQSEN